jgi:hypothetical protein
MTPERREFIARLREQYGADLISENGEWLGSLDGQQSQTMGHVITWNETADAWYFDDGTVADDNGRPCVLCQRPETPEGHDPCLGTLEGVTNACCGHGDVIHAYVSYPNGEVIRMQDALDLFTRLGVGPLNDREPR